jgi:hypothetical protein
MQRSYVAQPNEEALHRAIGGAVCSKRKALLTPDAMNRLAE